MKGYLTLSVVLILLVVVCVAGCRGRATASPTPAELSATPSPSREPQAASVPAGEPGTGGKAATPEPGAVTPPAGAREVVELAREDLARRLDLESAAIAVVSVQAVEWSDTSLGCPQPGMMYAQVITPGYRVALEAKGQRYDYHTDRSRMVVWCESGGDLPAKGTDTTVDDGWPSLPVDGGEVDTSRITPIVPPR